ncbi:MAG: sigma-E factor regulatory protein RseB domain-containing protein [Armatimonadota bacterium]|nr:sigma-E factor regulatory protein RseB domain-containing protein [Armatimonadota bacterium]
MKNEQVEQVFFESWNPELPEGLREKVLQTIEQRKSSHRWLLPHRRSLLASAAVAAIVAVALTGIFLLRQQPADAAEVIARAQGAFDRLKTCHYRYRRVDRTPYPPCGKDVTGEVWYEAPDRLTQQDGEGTTMYLVSQRGDETLVYTGCNELALLHPMNDIDRYVTRYHVANLPGNSEPDPMKILGPDIELAGAERFNGRLCDVLQSRDNPRRRLYIDRESGMIIRNVTFKENGSVLKSWELVSVEIDADIPDSVFDDPVPGVPVFRAPFLTWEYDEKLNGSYHAPFSNYDTRTGLRDPSLAGSELAELLAHPENADRLSVTVAYEPTGLPSGFHLVAVNMLPECEDRGEPKRSNKMNLHHYDLLEIDYVNPDTGETVTLIQGTKAWEGAGRWTGSEIRVNGSPGTLLMRSQPFTFSVMNWNDGTTYFTMGATGLSQTEVLRIAKSMRQVR